MDHLIGLCFVILLFIICLIIPIYFFISCSIASKKSKRVGPVTRIPIIPFSEDDLYIFKGTRYMKIVIPEARIQCSANSGTGITRKFCIEKMNSIMLRIFNLDRTVPDEFVEVTGQNGQRYYEKKPKNSVPNNSRTISIRMVNFKHGLKCHDFVPIDGISPGSYYTYQMFGDNRIQVTNYVENGVSYVAGFCIYIHNPTDFGECYRLKVINDCLNSRKYSGRNQHSAPQRAHVRSMNLGSLKQQSREAEVVIPCSAGSSVESTSVSYQISHPDEVSIEDMTIKYCSKLQRKVMSGLESGIVIHQEWNHVANKMMNEECQMCTELLNNEEPPAYSSLSIV